MKTLKLRMLVAALMLITAGFFAGCKANIATPVNPDSFALNADEYVDSDDPFKVELPITVNAYGEYDADKKFHLVTITFNEYVNEEGVKNGVKFYKLTDAANDYTMPAKADIEPTGLRVAGKVAYFTVPTKDVDHLYIYVKASETKAINGVKLNQDGDEIWGEAGDDDVASHKQLVAAPLRGNENYDKKTDDNNVTFDLNTVFARNLIFGTDADANLRKKVEIPAGPFIGYLDANAYPDDAARRPKIDEATGILNKHLKLEQYDWMNNKWEDKALNFSYDETNRKWVSGIEVEKNHRLRYKWVDKDKIKMELASYGYPIRASLKNNDETIETVNAVMSGFTSLEEGDIWPNLSKLTATPTLGQVKITLSAAGINFPFYIENNWPPVTEGNKDNTKKSLFAGFKPETVVKENFKCTRTVGGKEVLIPISQISLVQSDVTEYPKAFDTIIIKFAENVTANNVYISPSVRSAEFEGSYNDGGLKGKKIPELCFANIEPSDNPYAWKGWLKK